MIDFHTQQTQAAALARLAADYPWPQQQPAVAPRKDHGWLDSSTQDYLQAAVVHGAKLIVELGSWLGLSTRFLADHAPQATVISIDHWRGSPEHASHPQWSAMLDGLYDTFLASCWEYRRRVIPLRVTSLDGLCIVGYRGLHPDLIYVDADHSFEAVAADFACAMELFPQAAIVGDDWGSKSVREAVTVVAKRCGVTIEARRNAWRLVDRLNQRQAAEQVDRVRGDRLRPGDAERSAAEGKAMIAIPPRLPAH